MRHLLLLTAPLLLASVAHAAPRIDAAQVEVTLAPEKKSMMLGEPNSLRFVVRNRSAQNWNVQVGGDYQNALGRPNSFKVKVTDVAGASVPQPDAGMDFGGITGPEKIPSGGSYTFELFVPDWATLSRAGTYRISASKTLMLSVDAPGEDFSWSNRAAAVPVVAECGLEVVPRDARKMGVVIAGLGKAMLGSDLDKAEGAARTLASVQDERVIALFRRALQTRSYELKFTALNALSKFKSDEAFEGLKLGMATRGADMEGASTPEVATDLADNIRIAAAQALSASPNPQARAFLIAQRGDSSGGVRLTILHKLGTMPANEALPIVREMTHDKDPLVADEARRYEKLLSAR